tara:strand:- start:463 stop:846 length:384 start_codon:yes stop_codon:yes gene_type:complete
MATQIVILNKSYIKVDDDFHINWEEKGNAMPALDDSIHAVVFNTLPGDNEIQSKDASGMMTGNTLLTSTSDAVGSTTIADLLTWGETRQVEIELAMQKHDEARTEHQEANDGTAWTKTWKDYDPNYS